MVAPERRTATPRRRATVPGRRAVAKKRKPRARQPLPPWLLLGGGLLIGIASVLVFNVAKDVEWGALWEEAPPPKTASPKPAATPRFDFYTILPSQEVVVPDPAPPTRAKTESREKIQPAPAGVYYLQAGSFRKIDEARGLRAQVILLGTEASIQSVTIDRDTWHRVRVGPYKDPARLREVRQRLRDNEIETLLIRAHR